MRLECHEHRTSAHQHGLDDRDVEAQQVIPPDIRPFQLLEEVQSRCRLRRDGVDVLQPLQVARDVWPQTDRRWRVHEDRADQQLLRLTTVDYRATAVCRDADRRHSVETMPRYTCLKTWSNTGSDTDP
jgi:hypothetical protein